MSEASNPATSEPAATDSATVNQAAAEEAPRQRLVSLDAYRGLVMLAIASNGFGIVAAAKHFPDSRIWQRLAYQFEHVAWVGCSAWDLIQPSFMFMVGVSMTYSYSKRRSRGQSERGMFCHAMIRAVVLVILGIFLSSNWQSYTNFTFVNVLSQIGLGYIFLFLLWKCPTWQQLAAAAAILIAYWGWFAAFPLPASDLDITKLGMPADWQRLQGFEEHWAKNTNAAAAADVWFLNKFPRPEKFEYNRGGYQTLNFVPSLVTMIFGLLAGNVLRSPRGDWSKLGILIAAGVVALAVGMGIGTAGICPIVKRIWTPSFAIFSSGWCFLILAAFFGIIDMLKLRFWAFPLVVVGMNSIAMYLMSQLLKPWVRDTLKRHLGQDYLARFIPAAEPIIQSTLVALVLWLICYWLYRQKAFLRI